MEQRIFYDNIPNDVKNYIYGYLSLEKLAELKFINKEHYKIVTKAIIARKEKIRKELEKALLEYIKLPDINLNDPIRSNNIILKAFNGAFPIIFAAEIGSVACIKLLVDKKVEVNVQCPIYKFRGGETALIKAVARNDKEIVEFLLKNGADIFQACANDETVLHIAVFNNSIDSLKILIDHELKGDFEKSNNRCNSHNLLPITFAETLGYNECYQLLSGFWHGLKKKSNGKKIRQQLVGSFIQKAISTWEKKLSGVQSNFNTWMYIISKGNLNSLRRHLDNPNMTSSLADTHFESRQNIIHRAILLGNKHVLKMLMSFIINVDKIILGIANQGISTNLKHRIIFLVNQEDSSGNTPLHLAAKRGDLNLIKILLSNKLAMESLTKKNKRNEIPYNLTISKKVQEYLKNPVEVPNLWIKNFENVPFNWQTHIDASGFMADHSLSGVASYDNFISGINQSIDANIISLLNSDLLKKIPTNNNTVLIIFHNLEKAKELQKELFNNGIRNPNMPGQFRKIEISTQSGVDEYTIILTSAEYDRMMGEGAYIDLISELAVKQSARAATPSKGT